MRWLCSLLTLAALGGAGGCAGEPPPPADMASGSLLTAAQRALLVQVRDCRPSVEHPFTHVMVKVQPEQVIRYDEGPYPFPVGALVVKDEFSDRDCRTLSSTTLMRKEEAGYFPAFGDWRWQRVDPEGQVLEDGRVAGCAGCHTSAACRARDFVCSER